MSLIFGSEEANEIRRRDIANGVLSDHADYGSPAPRPERDAWGDWIQYSDDANGDLAWPLYMAMSDADIDAEALATEATS